MRLENNMKFNWYLNCLHPWITKPLATSLVQVYTKLWPTHVWRTNYLEKVSSSGPKSGYAMWCWLAGEWFLFSLEQLCACTLCAVVVGRIFKIDLSNILPTSAAHHHSPQRTRTHAQRCSNTLAKYKSLPSQAAPNRAPTLGPTAAEDRLFYYKLYKVGCQGVCAARRC